MVPLASLPQKIVEVPSFGGLTMKQSVPVGYCATCWIRWGRSIQGDAVPACQEYAFACQGWTRERSQASMRPMGVDPATIQKAREEYEKRRYREMEMQLTVKSKKKVGGGFGRQ